MTALCRLPYLLRHHRATIERLTAVVAAVTCRILACRRCNIFSGLTRIVNRCLQATTSVSSAAASCHAACAGSISPGAQHASADADSTRALMGTWKCPPLDGCHPQHQQGTARLAVSHYAATVVIHKPDLCCDMGQSEHCSCCKAAAAVIVVLSCLQLGCAGLECRGMLCG